MMGNKIFDAVAAHGDNYICDMGTGSFIFLFDYDDGRRYGLYFATFADEQGGVTPIAASMGFDNFFNGFTIKDSKLYLSSKSSTQHVVIWKLTTVI